MTNNSENDGEEEIKLFAEQKKIYPKRIWGRFRRLKWIIISITLSIYYLAPFIRWDRGPNAPDQAILIDLPARRAYWFFIEIWPQEVYFLTGILILAALTLFAVTSLFGRVWCGYFCFQTVWTDLFIWVERIVQGDRTKRKRLHDGPWTWEKIYKLTITHIIWLLIAWFTAGAFVLYFNDAPTLVRKFLEFDVSPTVLGFMGGLTFSTYLMAGFAREQVCKFMCPYARFQSAMFDIDTLIISYDENRGEPRGKHKKGTSWEGHGHCVDCTACVQVCPMGIDIRDGLQMECIACGLCIDACDGIMDKVGLPRGLIRYDTERHMQLKAKGIDQKFRIFRPRTFYYMTVLAVVGATMLYALLTRPPLELHVLHDRNPVFVRLSDGNIRNGYTIKVLNKTHDEKSYKLEVTGIEGAKLEVKGAGEIKQDSLRVKADSVGQFHVLVRAKPKGRKSEDINFILTDTKTGVQDEYKSVFITQR